MPMCAQESEERSAYMYITLPLNYLEAGMAGHID